MRKNSQTGFTLIEVLIALCLLGIALLAISKLELSSLSQNNQAIQQSIAIEQLRAMATILEINKNNISNYMIQWQKDNAKLLPHGKGQLDKNGNAFVISLHWRSAFPLWQCDNKKIFGESCVELYSS